MTAAALHTKGTGRPRAAAIC